MKKIAFFLICMIALTCFCSAYAGEKFDAAVLVKEFQEADKFFVLTSSRTSGLPEGGPTFIVPTKIVTEGVHKYKPIFVGFRNYLEQATKSGPIPEEMISPRVIKFSKPISPPVM